MGQHKTACGSRFDQRGIKGDALYKVQMEARQRKYLVKMEL
jgi:hypothetical protein